jgi:pimeloyl-ACP methyl ester carboxylesterase
VTPLPPGWARGSGVLQRDPRRPGGDDHRVRNPGRRAAGGVTPDDPNQAFNFEQTRDGLGGWIDDEVANASLWGFDVASIDRPTAVWYDPNDTTLPHQHGEWLAAQVPGAELIVTHALGHGSPDDPRPEWLLPEVLENLATGWLRGYGLVHLAPAVGLAGPGR